MTDEIELIANSYGKKKDEFIKTVIDYYIKNNAVPITFENEQVFQKYIELNITRLDTTLTLKESHYRFNLPELQGEIDLLCNHFHRENDYSIIEVKLKADYDSLGQLLFYIDSLNNLHVSPHEMFGIIIGIEISKQLIAATKQYNRYAKHKIQIFKFNTHGGGFTEIKEVLK